MGRLAALCSILVLLVVSPARSADQSDLAKALRIGEVIEVLRDEGLTYGAVLDIDMLDGQGGAYWAAQVARVYATDRMQDIVQTALLNGMNDDQINRSVEFFGSPRGKRILSLEVSARRAMVNPEVEQMAFDVYAATKDNDSARLRLITRLVEVNDLIERNVAGTLNSNYYFLRGLTEGGSSGQSEAEITSETWSQEDDIRTDTREWVYGFMLLAYDPLSDADLEAYITYSATPAGLALNAALFDGFDAMYLAISRDLGRLVAQAMHSSDL